MECGSDDELVRIQGDQQDGYGVNQVTWGNADFSSHEALGKAVYMRMEDCGENCQGDSGGYQHLEFDDLVVSNAFAVPAGGCA
jgi:hypothetical protein